MKYIREGANYITIPDDFEQVFRDNNFKIINLSQTIALHFNGIIDKNDYEIVNFIYDCQFATIDQIKRFCAIKGIEKVDSRVELLRNSSILNHFYMAKGVPQNNCNAIPNDAKPYYCLLQGGKQLLQQFSGYDYIEWEPGLNITCAKNVCKALLSTEVYINALESDAQVLNFSRNPMFQYKTSTLIAKAELYVKSNNGDSKEYIIIDSIRSTDKLDMIRKKIKCYESIFATNIWKTYYSDTVRCPMIFIYTDNDEVAKELAREIRRTTRIGTFLISTDDRLAQYGLSKKGALLKYDVESDSLDEVRYKIFSTPQP